MVQAFVRCARREEALQLFTQHDQAARNEGFTLHRVHSYPGWPGGGDNPLVEALCRAYRRETGREMTVTAVHVGLEPSVLGEKNPALHMASTGARTFWTPTRSGNGRLWTPFRIMRLCWRRPWTLCNPNSGGRLVQPPLYSKREAKRRRSMKKRVGILTSGGDCPGLNATLRGVAKALYQRMEDNVQIVGISNGYYGLIHGEWRGHGPQEFSGILTVGGTILGTRRTPYKLMRVIGPDNVDKVEAMKKHYAEMKLDCLLCLGATAPIRPPISSRRRV